MKRAAVVLVVVTGLVVASAGPAAAQPLDEWLDRAARAEFEGRQVTICDTPEGRISEVVEVAQKDQVVRIGAPSGELVIRAGAIITVGADGVADVSSVERASGSEPAERYSSYVEGPTEVAGRSATLVEVREGDLVRLRYAFDAENGAILRAEVNNGDGTIYCTTEFIEFRPETDLTVAEPTDVRQHLLAALSHQVSLPDEVAGFVKLDTYQGPGGSTAAYYSDGIFSFTVLVADRKITISELRGVSPVEVAGHRYIRRFVPGQVVYAWEFRDGGMVLIGNLPPDMQVAVLSGLPKPGTVNFLIRFWRRIFG